MSPPHPPHRPLGVGRPGTGDHPKPPLERSISPAPEGQRVPVLPAQVIEAQFEPTLRSEDAEDLLRAERAENARLKVEISRQSRVPELPSPRRAREQTARDWPPPSIPAPGYRPKQESAPEFHVHFEQARSRDDSLAPRSARQRAGDFFQSPLGKWLAGIIAAAAGGAGTSAVVVANNGPTAPEKPATSQEIGAKLVQNQRNFSADLEKNDKADRAREDWTEDELKKTNRRIRRCEAKLKLQADDELQPDAPPEAPPPPRKPDLPEKL